VNNPVTLRLCSRHCVIRLKRACCRRIRIWFTSSSKTTGYGVSSSWVRMSTRIIRITYCEVFRLVFPFRNRGNTYIVISFRSSSSSSRSSHVVRGRHERRHRGQPDHPMALLAVNVQIPFGCQDRVETVASVHRVRRVQLFDFHTSRTRGAPI